MVIFLAFPLMLLIPNYWYTVPFFFACNAAFYLSVQTRGSDDLMFSCMLPVKRRDVVRGRVLFLSLFQLASALSALGCVFLNHAIVKVPNISGIDANLALIGFGLLLVGIFNRVFLPTFYKTGIQAGKAFLKGTAAVFSGMLLVEIANLVFGAMATRENPAPFALWWANHIDTFPTLTTAWLVQIGIAVFCTLCYTLLTLRGCRISERRFEQVDL